MSYKTVFLFSCSGRSIQIQQNIWNEFLGKQNNEKLAKKSNLMSRPFLEDIYREAKWIVVVQCNLKSSLRWKQHQNLEILPHKGTMSNMDDHLVGRAHWWLSLCTPMSRTLPRAHPLSEQISTNLALVELCLGCDKLLMYHYCALCVPKRLIAAFSGGCSVIVSSMLHC